MLFNNYFYDDLKDTINMRGVCSEEKYDPAILHDT
jgi:hypothetical protein